MRIFNNNKHLAIELIDTLWNVNVEKHGLLEILHLELIDTLWNVNLNQQSLGILLLFELIDTLWNVNLKHHPTRPHRLSN